MTMILSVTPIFSLNIGHSLEIKNHKIEASNGTSHEVLLKRMAVGNTNNPMVISVEPITGIKKLRNFKNNGLDRGKMFNGIEARERPYMLKAKSDVTIMLMVETKKFSLASER